MMLRLLDSYYALGAVQFSLIPSVLASCWLMAAASAIYKLIPMFQDLTSLVLDIGTCKTRVGYGGDDAPKVVCSSYVARPTVMEREN